MPVRAKFRVTSITKYTDYHSVTLEPVRGETPENKEFFKYTPSGEIKLGVVKAETLAEFEPGDEFYIDFTKAEQAPK